MKLKAALIGCGRIGTKKHLEAYIANREEVSLEIVCDIELQKAEKAAILYEREVGNKPLAIRDYSEILSKDIDWVSIATESGYHYTIAKAFLENGKHVLVEKPMALGIADMDEMITLAKTNHLRLGVCFQNRFNAPVQQTRGKIIENGFGRLFHATARILWNRNEEYYKQAKWRGTWALDGGTLMNQCSHNIDLLQWLVGGEVEQVYSVLRNFNHPSLEVEDFGAAIVTFRNGCIGLIEGTANVFPTNLEETLSIFGETGTVVLGGVAVNKMLTWKFPGEESHPFLQLPDPDSVYGSGHIPLFKDFCEAVRENKPSFISGEEGKKAVELILGIYRSFKEKRPIFFPLKEFRSVDMIGTTFK